MHEPPKTPEYASDEQRWNAVRERDPRADGRFFYAVKTTGIFCRPDCPSRLPRRRNVEFFDSKGAAAGGGYRPCKRCRPTATAPRQLHAEMIARSCRRIDEADESPSLTELAAAAGLSPAYFHRLFKQALGVTPRQYAASQRMHRFRDQLQTSPTVTEAIYAAGFNSSSRAYENVTSHLGMSPSTYRQGGQGLSIRYVTAPCSLGHVVVATTERGICAIELADSEAQAESLLALRFPQAQVEPAAEPFAEMVQAVAAFVDAPDGGLDLPLDAQGTAFQHRVWDTLRQIPLGTTVSYGELAARLGKPRAHRAVASACAANPLAVLVPCHRVFRADGGIGGYRWGEQRKLAMQKKELELAKAAAEK